MPLPRLIASAKRPPSRTAFWIFAITRRWSSDHASWYTSGKYVSQKRRKSSLQASRRAGSATGGSSPMSRPEAERSACRWAAASRCAEYPPGADADASAAAFLRSTSQAM